MNTVEKIKDICKSRKIPISKLEKECGFSNAYISQLRKGTLPSDRLIKVSNYLKVPAAQLLDDDVALTNQDETAKIVINHGSTKINTLVNLGKELEKSDPERLNRLLSYAEFLLKVKNEDV